MNESLQKNEIIHGKATPVPYKCAQAPAISPRNLTLWDRVPGSVLLACFNFCTFVLSTFVKFHVRVYIVYFCGFYFPNCSMSMTHPRRTSVCFIGILSHEQFSLFHSVHQLRSLLSISTPPGPRNN